MEEKKILDKYNFANLFSVILNGNNSYYNICRTIRINNILTMLLKYYTKYLVKPKDTWTNISYKFYNTYKLWWIICKFNNILDPFKLLNEGRIIKVPKKDVVNVIIENLDTL